MTRIAQQYSKAAQSSDLTCDQWHQHTDVLAAVALSSELGGLLWRVKYSNDATSYGALLTSWHAIVKRKAELRTWPAEISPSQIARLSLDHWLTDICPSCTGRGWEPVKDVPSVMSDTPCKSCNGTSKRALQVKHAIQKYVEEMVETLENMQSRAASVAMHKLSAEMDLY